jgi:membrane-associated protein
VLLCVAAILGDAVNYAIGLRVGPRVFRREDSWLFKKEHLLRTQRFYERHGGKTIILARFIPIIRTFAPFVAGIGRMRYRRFALFNVTGGIAWVAGFVLAGYAFGNMPIVKRNFQYVILAIIVLSVLPAVFEYLRQRNARVDSQV